MSVLGKRTYSDSNRYEPKRGSYIQEEKETPEESIRAIGMQKEPLAIQEIQKLVENLKHDVNTRKNIIICTIIDCMSTTRFKIPVYSTLVGLLNQIDEDFGSDFVESLVISLQDAIEDCNPQIVTNLIVGLSDLVNVNVVQCSSVLSLLELFISSAIDSQSTLYTEWLLRNVLYTLPFIGQTLENNRLFKEVFSKLIVSITSLVTNRKNDYTKALRIWVKSETFFQIEHLDLLYTTTLGLRKNKWETFVIDRPYENIQETFNPSKNHKFTISKLPTNFLIKKFTLPCVYFQLFDEMECQDLKICNQFLPSFESFERFYISQQIIEIIEAYDEFKSVYLIKSMVSDSDYNIPYIIVEAIINKILFFNDFSGSHIKYFVLICALCKDFKEVFNVVLEQAIESIFNNLEHMNAACIQRFVDFFVFYANFLNCSFSWQIFDGALHLDSNHPKKLFYLQVVSKLFCLVDVKKNEILAKLIRKINLPSPELHFQFSTGDCEMVVIQSFVGCIKAKASVSDIIKELEQFRGNPNIKFVFALVQTILKGGFQTPTHTAHVIDKYLPILKHFIVTEEDSKACIEAAYDAWQKNLTKVKHVIQLLEQRKVIDPLSIVSGFLTLELESMKTNLLSWEIVSAQVSLLACKFARLRDNHRKLKNTLKAKIDEDSDDKASRELSDAKKAKDDVKEERIKLLYLIVTKIFDSISLLTRTADYKKVSGTWLIYILQRFQQILFENFEFFYHSQSLLQSIIEYSNNDEHVIEIINRFQTIYT